MTHPHLFLLGLASGVAVLAITSYRRVTPGWLRGLLMASGFLIVSRYVSLALFTAPDAPQGFWTARYCWFASSIGLSLPSVFAIDQVLRHPAMTPKKLLRWYSPFLLLAGAVTLFGGAIALALTQEVFALGFIGVCVMLILKIPSWPIRRALIGLAAAQGYLGLDSLLLAMGGSYFRPFLYSEMLTLLALWHAYETAWALQQTP